MSAPRKKEGTSKLVCQIQREIRAEIMMRARGVMTTEEVEKNTDGCLLTLLDVTKRTGDNKGLSAKLNEDENDQTPECRRGQG